MDPLSITVSVIGPIQAISSTREALKTIKDLPKAFEHVEIHLPLVERTLGDIQNNLELRTLADGQRQSIDHILKDCEEKAKKLKDIVDALKDKFQKDADSKSWGKLRGWYRIVLQGVKAHRVESLMTDILRDLEILSLHESFSLATREDTEGIKKALNDFSEVEPSLEDSEFPVKTSISNVWKIGEDGNGRQEVPTEGQNAFNPDDFIVTGGGNTINFGEVSSPFIPESTAIYQMRKKVITSEIYSYEIVLINCVNLLCEFQSWHFGDDHRLLWITGGPGKGKTMLLYEIVETLENDPNKHFSQARVPIYFFCEATDDQLNTAESVMQSLLSFLIDRSPSPRSKYLYSKGTYRAGWDMLVQKVEDVLRDLDEKGVYLIVDALDECVSGREKLLKAIVKLAESSLKGIRILVSSRNLTDIWDELSFSKQTMKLSLEQNDMLLVHGVRFFVNDQITALAKKKKISEELREEIREYLASHCGNSFLWVVLVCKELAKSKLVDSAYEMLHSNFPPGLVEIYGRMMESINHSSEDPSLCKEILAIACAVFRPITWSEMKSLLGSSTIRSLDSVIGSCGSFLTVRTDERMSKDDDKIIDFVHSSAKDFLLAHQDASRQILPHGLAHQHYCILEKSLANLSGVLRRDIYHLGNPEVWRNEIKAPEPDPLAPVKYSCVYWPEHLFKLGKQRSQDLTTDAKDDSSLLFGPHKGDFDESLKDERIVHAFFKKSYLYWLEALSLLSAIPRGLDAMRKLEFLLREKRNKESRGLVDLVKDARSIILQHEACLENAPLHIHSIALSPDGRLVATVLNDQTTTLSCQSHPTATFSYISSGQSTKLSGSRPVEESLTVLTSIERSQVSPGVFEKDCPKGGSDLESLGSDAEDIRSQVSARTTIEEMHGKVVMGDCLAEESRFRSLCEEAMENMDEDRFTRNLRRLLKGFYIGLLKEARNEAQRAATDLLRSRRGRSVIGHRIFDQLAPDSEKLPLDAEDPTSQAPQGLGDPGKVDQWLDKIQAGMHTAKPASIERQYEDLEGASDPDLDDNDNDEDEDEDDEHHGQTSGASFPQIEVMKAYLQGTKAFNTLLVDFMALFLPKELRLIIGTIPIERIWISRDQDLSVANLAKAWVEDQTRVRWNWWPMQRRKRMLHNGEVRMFWRSAGLHDTFLYDR
ncbi:hypothetical protein G7054_g906 [Neopestalotiopsis clavispora]|nr:hypothetical protein G7054_g906 [Neopestalotiopsis clavispora]